MDDFNKTFQFEVHELEVIEEALQARRRELSRMRASLDDANAAEAEVIRVIEHDQRAGDELLDRVEELMTFAVSQGVRMLKLEPV